MHRGLPWSAKSADSGSTAAISKLWVTSGAGSFADVSTFTPSLSVTTRMQMMHAQYDADVMESAC